MNPIYQGTVDNQVQPGGGISVSSSVSRTVVIRGLRTTLEAAQRTTYLRMSRYEVEWVIEQTDLVDEVGGMARLTLKLIPALDSGWASVGSAPEQLETRVEIDWQSIEKPIMTSKRLYPIQNSSTYTESCAAVEAWRNSPPQRKRAWQYPKADLTQEADVAKDEHWDTLGGTDLLVAQKIASGVEGYLVFSPVVKRISKWTSQPQTGSCGKIGNPPVAFVAGYIYLKNGDSAVQGDNKTWTRTETWQGADAWDTDLYET